MIIFENIKGEENWQTSNPKPILIRVMILPNQLGDRETDNDHGELMALILIEETLPCDAIVLDSTGSDGLDCRKI
jgi:hypothetical protein